MAGHILITGASGFVGRCLFRELSQREGNHLYVLARSEKAQQKILAHIHDCDTRRVQFLRGDVTFDRLGIDTPHLLELSRKIDEVWHLAASTSFDDAKRPEIEAINLGGTRNLTEILAGFNRLKMLYHVSTAYCCGHMEGLVPEDYFPRPASFRNVYEETKYEAECVVRASHLPAVVVRPSIVMGDSRNGENFGERRMVYGYAVALYLAVAHACGGAEAFRKYWRGAVNGAKRMNLDARLMISERTPLNVVTVDDVVSVCLAIRELAGKGARIFNLVNSVALSLGSFLENFQRLLRVYGFRFDTTLTHKGLSKDNIAERVAYRHTQAFRPYMVPPEPQWAMANVSRLPVRRVEMTERLYHFLMQTFMERELMGHVQ